MPQPQPVPTQRLSLSATAIASATGTATFNFPAPATDLVWHGTMICQTAPIAAIFSGTVAGFQWSSWSGASVGGPFQALPGEVVQVTATGLTPGVGYLIQWTGRSDSLSQTAPSWPDTNSSPPGGAVNTVVPPSGSALEVFEVGGLLYVFNNNGSATTTTLLGPPGAGNVWRLQRAVYSLSGTSAVILGDSTQNEYGVTTATTDRENFDGLCVSEGLDWQTVGGAGKVWLYYDLISKPTLVGPKAIGVQQTASGQGVGTIAVTLTGVTPGNQIIALHGSGQNSPGGAATIATTGGTTSAWNLARHTNQTALAQASIWSALAGSSSVTVTVTVPNDAGGGQLTILEVAKLNGTADATSINSGGGVSTFSAGSLTPGGANDLAVTALGTNVGNISGSPAGWVRDGTTGSGGNGALAAHVLPSGSSALTPAFTSGGGAGSFAIVAASFSSL